MILPVMGKNLIKGQSRFGYHLHLLPGVVITSRSTTKSNRSAFLSTLHTPLHEL